MLGGEIIENGKSYVRNPSQFFEYAGKFVQVIRENKAEPVFYMTWSRKQYPQHQRYLTFAYMEIARKTGSKIAPVGMVWNRLRTENLVDLFESDGAHPSVYGAYTAAIMIFSVIFDTDPKGIPGRLEGYKILKGGKISGVKSLLCELESREVKVIQNAVSVMFRQIKKENGYLEVERAVSNKKPARISKIANYLSDARGQLVVLIVIVGMILVLKGCIILFNR
jgi:hypothetical protein